MDIGEGMCYGECCELSKTDDSQTCTPEANNTLCVNKFLKNSYLKRCLFLLTIYLQPVSQFSLHYRTFFPVL